MHILRLMFPTIQILPMKKREITPRNYSPKLSVCRGEQRPWHLRKECQGEVAISTKVFNSSI